MFWLGFDLEGRGSRGFQAGQYHHHWVLFFIYFLIVFYFVAPHSLWDLSSLTRDRTWAGRSESSES